jgi:hypothetical protein
MDPMAAADKHLPLVTSLHLKDGQQHKIYILGSWAEGFFEQ